MASSFPFFKNKMLGWIAPISLPSLTGGVVVQVFPKSLVRSKWTRQPPSPSVLLPHRISPFASGTGLFLMGPRMPSGSRVGFDHVLPSSVEVVIRSEERRVGKDGSPWG